MIISFNKINIIKSLFRVLLCQSYFIFIQIILMSILILDLIFFLLKTFNFIKTLDISLFITIYIILIINRTTT